MDDAVNLHHSIEREELNQDHGEERKQQNQPKGHHHSADHQLRPSTAAVAPSFVGDIASGLKLLIMADDVGFGDLGMAKRFEIDSVVHVQVVVEPEAAATFSSFARNGPRRELERRQTAIQKAH